MAMSPISFEAGAEIVRQGAEGDMFYIVESGTCDIAVAGVGNVMEIPCASKEDATVERRYFGELALLYDAPRAATVSARDAVKTWGLDRVTFKSILQDSASKMRLLYFKFLEQVPLFQNVDASEKTHLLQTLCDSLKAVDYVAGDVVIKEGDEGEEFFLIESGTAEATQTAEDGAQVSVCPTYSAGAFFGELALLSENRRAATRPRLFVTTVKMCVYLPRFQCLTRTLESVC